jgi:RNA polymerase primary sigma factor
MTAIDSFDAFRGLRFSTFATHWIRQAIGRSQANEGRSVRFPVHVHEGLKSFYQQLITAVTEFKREPSSTQIARLMHMDVDKMEYLVELGKPLVSLDLIFETYRDSVEELLWDDTVDSENFNIMDYSLLKNAVARALSTLSARESEVIRLRFGIGERGPYTLERIGQVFGVTRERIRQIEAKALRKLSHPSRARPLRNFWVDH